MIITLCGMNEGNSAGIPASITCAKVGGEMMEIIINLDAASTMWLASIVLVALLQLLK
jgi:hypothetical protein